MSRFSENVSRLSTSTLVASLLALVQLIPACSEGSGSANDEVAEGTGGAPPESPNAGGAGQLPTSAPGGAGPIGVAPPSENAAVTVPLPSSGAPDKPVPAGSTMNLAVLPWAGFTAALSYTFDDSQPSQVQHYDALQALGVPLTFYISTYTNWQSTYDEVWSQAVTDGHEVANHTVNHCYTDGTTSGGDPCDGWLGSLDAELDECTTYIAEHFGQPAVWTMAYPFGDTDWRASAEARFFIARGVGSGTVRTTGDIDFFNLPVLTINGGETPEDLVGDVDSTLAAGGWGIFLFHSILPTTDNWYAGCDIASITASVAHAKQLGTVWVDTVVNVGAYLAGQKAIEAALAQAPMAQTVTWTLPAHFPPGHGVRVTVDGGTLSQGGQPLTWDPHGYYEVALDAASLSWAP